MLTEAQKHILNLDVILREKNAEIARQYARISELRTANDTLTGEYRHLADDHRRLTEQVRRMQDLLAANQDMNLRLATMNEELATKAQDVVNTAQALQAERNAFEQECIRLRGVNAEQRATIREVSALLEGGNRQQRLQAEMIRSTIDELKATIDGRKVLAHTLR